MTSIEDSCNICFETINITISDSFVKSQCRPSTHPVCCSGIFHVTCLNEWLNRSDICPMCRTSFTHRISNFPQLRLREIDTNSPQIPQFYIQALGPTYIPNYDPSRIEQFVTSYYQNEQQRNGIFIFTFDSIGHDTIYGDINIQIRNSHEHIETETLHVPQFVCYNVNSEID